MSQEAASGKSALATPMMRQYLEIKAAYPDAVLFYRMGDFYEMFLDDATRVAPLLDITLTSRHKDKADAIPMCGVPVHAAEQHMNTLVGLGFKVAVCEQVEDPKSTAKTKLVKRAVVEVLTPGLRGDPEGIEAKREVALAALVTESLGRGVGLAALDASTGDFRSTSVDGQPGLKVPLLLLEELERIEPLEILVPRVDWEELEPLLAERLPRSVLTRVPTESCLAAGVANPPEGFDPRAEDSASMAAAGVLAYLRENQPFSLRQRLRLRSYTLSDAMILDASTRAHLELFENSEDRGRSGTLIRRIDECVTPLGSRRLARWLAYPLLDPSAICDRLDVVEFFADNDRGRAKVRDALKQVRDLERMLAKAGRPSATPRELGALRTSLLALPSVVDVLQEALAEEEGKGNVLPALPRPQPIPEAARLLVDSLVDDPPAIPKGSRGANETGYIRPGFRPELDEIHQGAAKGREWIAGLENQERERTGISTLKVRFHPVHGYSIEVTKAQLDRVPENYVRKQTLASVERYTTPELSDVAQSVLGARDRAASLEREIFQDLRQAILDFSQDIREAADAVANLDAFAALAEVARRDEWVRPDVDNSKVLDIEEGRHPVVEAMLLQRGEEEFVANHAFLDPDSTQLVILTGPNMSGKSTYLRQVALIALLAQIGSFVPATRARIGVVDRLFTRVGASDRLARGESTFMVEMRETAAILSQASDRSLVILDEIGRGTSTFDGLSIAWAVAEYLHDTPGARARTLFATHYHELSDLERTKVHVKNGHFDAREVGEDVVFLRRLVDGGANSSYGIQVARLAGLPETVLLRAKEILHNLEAGEFESDGSPQLARSARAEGVGEEMRPQLSLFAPPGPTKTAVEAEVLAAIKDSDLDRLTPIDALLTLRRWVEKLQGGSKS